MKRVDDRCALIRDFAYTGNILNVTLPSTRNLGPASFKAAGSWEATKRGTFGDGGKQGSRMPNPGGSWQTSSAPLHANHPADQS